MSVATCTPLTLIVEVVTQRCEAYMGRCVHSIHTHTHLGYLNSTLPSAVCITQLLSSGLKFLDVQD